MDFSSEIDNIWGFVLVFQKLDGPNWIAQAMIEDENENDPFLKSRNYLYVK